MLAGYEFECPVCKLRPENGNDLEEHLIVKHDWDKDAAREVVDQQRAEAKMWRGW